MEISSVFILSIFIIIPVEGQVLDDMLDDFILIGGIYNGAVCRMAINNNNSCVYIAFPNWIYPYDIDYDPVDHIIYWINDMNEISSGSLFGNSEITVRSSNGFARVSGIAVDAISRLLFYTDIANHVIAAIHIEDSFQKTVISSGLANPGAIVIDLINGILYWADSGSPAKIEKSNYDGTNRHELVNTGLSSPYGLALDINDGVLYWCEIGTFRIERANVDGSNRTVIYQDQVTVDGCSIALYHSFLYFKTSGQWNSFMRIETDGRGLIDVDSSAYLNGLAIHVHINGRIGQNGCSNASGGCSHFCFPLHGGNNECACPDLMTLQVDGKTCRQDDLPGEFMIAADTYGVLLRIDITNNYSYVNIPFPNLVYAFDLDYDRTDDVIYWININNQIKSGSIFGMNIKTVFYLNGIAQSNGIAVDSISRLLFYTDLRNQIIAIINLKDYAHKTVINSGLGKPRAIVIDPINGKLYWIDSGNPPKIETSNYDGTNRQDIVNTGLTSPYGLDVDMHARVLYWCEIGTFKIKRANVDGSNQSLIYQEQVALQGCSIAFYQSYLYFTTWSYRNVIMRIRTDGSGLIFVASSTRINPLGIYVNHNGHLGSNGCSNGNGGCSDFCFPQPNGYVACSCPDMMTLRSDGKTCHNDTLPEDFILVLDESKIYIYRMNINNYTQFSIKIQNGSYPNAIDYDPNAAVMFWTDLSFRHIKSGSIYGNKHTTFGNFNQYAVLSGISLDVISGLLFYTDIGQNFIGVINIDANVTKTIISDDINTPQALVTDPTSGTIYWSSLTKIEKSSYDGTRRQELINTGLNASVDLAVDINVGVMYWCHYNTRKIEVANVDGSNRQVLYKDQATIYKCSIALHQSYLYYIDSSQSALMRIATDGSGMKSVVPSIFHDVMDIHVHSNTTLNQGINGCSNGRGGCSHFCFPQPGGSKVCDCPDDMTLQPDGLSCGKYISPETFLLFLDQRSRCIYIMDICNYKYVTIALKNIYAPYAIGYDPIDRNIYFTDYRFMQIVSVSIDENTQRTMRQLNISPHDIEIAVDAVSRLLFYSDSMISVLSLDGFMQKVVISNITGIPSDLVIDPINGHIYWTTSEYNGKIEKSNYDGTNRQEIINSGLGYLTGLAIDIQAGVLYWCDYSTTSKIERANVDGTNRQVIYQGQDAQFYTIALHQSNLYIMGSQQRMSLMRIGTDGSNPVFVGPPLSGYISKIWLHSNESASLGPNGCSSKNGGCSHFCFPRPGGLKVCDCPDGLTLRFDGHTCRSFDDVCDDQPCKNGAVCTNIYGSYLCNCPRGWQGQNCSSDVDECSDNPCQNSGVCTNMYGSYLCNCSRGWQAQNCSDVCSLGTYGENCSSICGHCANATCDHIDGTCHLGCSEGYNGTRCSDRLQQSESSTESRSTLQIDIPVGGALGALGLMSIILFAILYCKRRKRAPQTPEIDPTYQDLDTTRVQQETHSDYSKLEELGLSPVIPKEITYENTHFVNNLIPKCEFRDHYKHYNSLDDKTGEPRLLSFFKAIPSPAPPKTEVTRTGGAKDCIETWNTSYYFQSKGKNDITILSEFPATSEGIWRLALEHGINLIIIIGENCISFKPKVQADIGTIQIECIDITVERNLLLCNINISDCRKDKKTRNVQVIVGDEELCALTSINETVAVLKKRFCMRQGMELFNTLINCMPDVSNGEGFVASLLMTDAMERSGYIDINGIIEAMRKEKHDAVNSFDKFKFCHDVIFKWIVDEENKRRM